MSRLHTLRDCLFDGYILRDGTDIETRGHHLLCDGVLESQRALDHLALLLVEDTLALAGFYHVPYLLAGDVRGLERLTAGCEFVDGRRQVVKQCDERPQQLPDEIQRGCDGPCPRVGVFDSVGLWRTLAEQEYHRGDTERRDENRRAVGEIEPDDCRRDGGHRDVDEVVADQNRHEQTVRVGFQ